MPYLALLIIVGSAGAFLITRDMSSRARSALNEQLLDSSLRARALLHEDELYLLESASLAANLDGMSTAISERDSEATADLLGSVLALKDNLNLVVATVADGTGLVEFSRDSPEAGPVSGSATSWKGIPFVDAALADTAGAKEAGILTLATKPALAIAALVPKTQSRIYLDFEANYANATGAEAGQYRILHFGTHGLLNSEQPELTGILFSMVDENGKPQSQSLLRLGEVYNLKLPVELVVLSGSQTALGKEIRGEGLVGLTRGFMYAGAPRVVASLWKVDDAMTAEVMKHFYRAMLGTKRLAPAAALREAQKEMLRQKIEPFYWSAFIIQGEWR